MGARMPRKYVAEMVMDRISASRNYLGEEYTYHEHCSIFLKSKEKLWFIHHRQRKSWRDFSGSWINTERIRPCGISAMYIYVITAEKK